MSRGKLDIIANILNATEKDVLKDHILQKCNMSRQQFDKYIELLLQNGLVDAFPAVELRAVKFNSYHMPGAKNKRRMIYHISEAGKQFLTLYSELSALVNRNASISFKRFSFLFRQKGFGVFLHRQGR